MGKSSIKNKRTLFVGLDAACWEFYQPLLDAGKLPALARLMAGGSRGIARSTMPAWTPTAWASIMTGKNPGKHGIYDMFWLRPGTFELIPTNARFRQGTPFWTRLNEAGLKVGLVNIPFTHPPDPVDGFVVTGFGAPPGQVDFAYPPEAGTWITEHYGEYEPWLKFSEFKKRDQKEHVEADLEHQHNQVQIGLGLAEKYAVDVLAINLMAPDHANHLSRKMDLVEKAIIQTDRDLQDLLDGFQPDNVMLFSDHGSRRVEGDLLLHQWFKDQGYAVQKERDAGEKREVLHSLLGRWLRRGHKVPRFLVFFIRRLIAFLLPFASQRQADRLWEMVEEKLPFAQQVYSLSPDLDPDRTSIFTGSSRSGLIYVNLKGRQAPGHIPESQKDALVDEMVRNLKSIRDPERDQPLFEGVYKADEIYHGPTVVFAPDITIDFYSSPFNVLHTFRRGAYIEKLSGKYLVQNQGEFGHHSRDGLFVFCGLDFDQGPEGLVLTMMDLPALLLNIYQVPIPEDWDGEVRRELLHPDLRSRPVEKQPGDPEKELDLSEMYSDEENEDLTARLEALGYL